MRVIDCNLELCKELDKWLICESIVKNAMFDNTFTKEFNYYASNESSYEGKIKDQTKVVLLDNELIAYVVIQYYEYNDIKEVSFNPIVINPKFHNQGFGKRVIQYIIEHIKEIVNGEVNRFDATISEQNIISKKLFTSLGFKPTGSSRDKTYIYYSLEV